MVDLLFENQTDWEFAIDPTDFFEDYATQLTLDLTQFRNDVADSEVDARITRDQDAGVGLGVDSTPTFYLEQVKIDLPTNATEFETIVGAAIDEVDQAFTVNRFTGDIVVYDASLLDATSNPTIQLPVMIEDIDGNVEIVEVTVNVTN